MNANEPAFGETLTLGDRSIQGGGLTKREYMATKIMASLVGNTNRITLAVDSKLSEFAVQHADELLKALEPHDDRCNVCKRKLNQVNDSSTKNCGGDCLKCKAEAGDPDAMREMDIIENHSL